ncbi:MAG: lysozyme inhibitor LprI family protein [Pyrinomonadaceae bacterium]
MRKFLCAGALLCLLAPTVVPQGGKHPCEQAGTQYEATECAGREYKQADAELNKVYQQVLKQEDKDGQARLRAAQLSWLKFRDTECEYEAGDYIGGTMRPMVAAFCLAAVTNERTKQLKEILRAKSDR